jgi:hypothetical protein
VVVANRPEAQPEWIESGYGKARPVRSPYFVTAKLDPPKKLTFLRDSPIGSFEEPFID